MSSDWREVTLEEVTTLLGDGLHGTPNYDDSGDYYFINGRNLSEGKIILDEKTKRANEEEYLKHKKDLNDRTILVSINGTLGNIAFYSDENVFLGKSACYFNVNDEVEKEFIYYVLKNDVFQNHIDREATGTTIKNVSLKTMRGFSFKLPPLETQEKIVSILGSIDQKIHLNQQTNETLETMAQAIFKSWFVDFDPVRAKIEARSAGRDPNRTAMAAIAGISQDQDWDEIEAALDQKLVHMSEAQQQQLSRTAELFPDELVESEIGEVPKGWGFGNLGEICSVQGGYAFKSKLFKEEGYPVVKIKNINENYTVGLQNGQFLSKEDIIGKETYELKDGDYVLAMTGATVGKTGVIVSNSEKVMLNQRVAKFESDQFEGNINWFIHSAFLSTNLKDQIVNLARGSAQPNISASGIESANLIIPSKPIIEEFLKIADPLFKKWIDNYKKNEILSGLRDTLLPKLISGEATL